MSIYLKIDGSVTTKGQEKSIESESVTSGFSRSIHSRTGHSSLEKNEDCVSFCEYMLLIISNVLGKKAQEFHLDTPISQFGLDSIGVVTIVSIVNKVFKLKISPVSLYGYKTVEEAASNLYSHFKDKIDFAEITSELIQSFCNEILHADSEQQTEQKTEHQTTVFRETPVNKESSFNNPEGLISTLFERAQNDPDFVAYTLLDAESNQIGQITNANLHKNSLHIAKEIQDKCPNLGKVLLLFDKSINFIHALCGTFYSGSIAIPFTAPPHDVKDSYVNGLIGMIKDSKPDVIFTTKKIFSQLSYFASEKISSHAIKFIIYEDIDFGENIDSVIVKHNPLALIQYSTGLSSSPKGTLYCHADLIKHLKRIQTSYQLGKESRLLSWVPADHYMGLFYGLLLPLYSSIPAYLYTETNIKFKAQMWLRAISKYHITFTGGPGFAYELCGDITEEESSEKFNLSSWKTAYVGAQVISREVIKRFFSKFKQYGFSLEAVCPSYGASENPLISTASIACDHEQAEIIFSGKKVDNIDVQIINPLMKAQCKEGEFGEIWFSDNGDESFISKTGKPYSIYSERVKNDTAALYVRTGDMGYMKNEMLYVCGKMDDCKQPSNPQLIEKEKQNEAIAVVGMAGVFPQSDSCAEFWCNLEAGKDLISEIPENRWDWEEIYGDPDNENQITDIKWGGFINDIEAFDASFFNISSREAQLMDPMQRKLIQVVWQAVEDAGYRMSDFSGKKVGVLVGIGTFDYLQLVLEDEGFTHAYASTGIVHCMASNRISYLFDFKGPSESVDTACSSSLVALHRAVGLIRNNDCEMAIVCGSNVLLSSSVYVALSNAGMLSKSGKCRTFDDKADGYVRGEGVGAIVLRKLKDAKLNNDNIYGLIKGVAVNHGGHTASLTAPNPFSQAKVIVASLKDAAIDASTISYIETHGTATALGDPIEICGLTEAFAVSTNTSNEKMVQHCALGSVKTNIGHLEAAAGISSVIKVLLSMRYKKIPAHLHFTALNKNINLEDTPFYLSGETTEWKLLKNKAGEAIPRRAGVSSFGFGGVNSHVTIEEYQKDYEENGTDFIKNVFLFSAKTEAALSCYIETYCSFLREKAETINLNNVAYTLQMGRESFDYRLAIIAGGVDELLAKLINLNENKPKLSEYNIDNVYYARVQNRSSSMILKSRSEDLEKLAQSWVLGENIDWKQLYVGQSISRISLPTYPFEKKHHWISKPNKNEKKGTLVKDTYDVNWYAEPILGDFEDGNAEYIIFCDRQGVSESLINNLRSKKIKVHKIYYDGDRKNIDDNYTVNSTTKNSYIDIFSKIADKSKNKKFNVLNCWPLDFGLNTEPGLDELRKDYTFLCQAAICQVQALINLEKSIESHLWIICANVQPVLHTKINLTSAPLWGMVRTLVLEQPSFFRAIIDIDFDEKIVVENLLREINSFSKESEVVYRQGDRYVPRMEPCEVEQSKECKLNIAGAYLITGGLGSLGLLVAEWLSSLKVSKVYLLSRRSPNENNNYSNIKATLDRIESNGTKVEILQGDVTNLEQMQSIAKDHFKFEEFKGVFHLAGSYQESLLEDVEFDDFKRVVSAKIEGTWILHQIFKDQNLDCFVMFSSGASVWGAATGGHYSAGNYFLDAYADYCEANNLFAMSISWGGLWQSTGLIPKNKEEYFKSIGVKETSPEEGLQQLASIMDSSCYKKIIAPIEWSLFLEVMSAQREKSLFNRMIIKDIHDENNAAENKFLNKLFDIPSYNERYQLIISELQNLIKNILSIEDEAALDQDIGFFNLGMDSLASIDFKNKINKTMGVNISTTNLFDCNTLRLLCDFLLNDFFKENNDVNDDEKSELNKFNNSELLKSLELELDNSDGRSF